VRLNQTPLEPAQRRKIALSGDPLVVPLLFPTTS
jgi:hypothetical protein